MNPSAPYPPPPRANGIPPNVGAAPAPYQQLPYAAGPVAQAPTYAQVMHQEAAQAQQQPAPPGAPQPPQGAQGRPPQPRRTNPNSTQNTLQIAEVRDGIVIMNDGSFRSVVMVKSINFDLMSQQEQEAVEYSLPGFFELALFPGTDFYSLAARRFGALHRKAR